MERPNRSGRTQRSPLRVERESAGLGRGLARPRPADLSTGTRKATSQWLASKNWSSDGQRVPVRSATRREDRGMGRRAWRPDRKPGALARPPRRIRGGKENRQSGARAQRRGWLRESRREPLAPTTRELSQGGGRRRERNR